MGFAIAAPILCKAFAGGVQWNGIPKNLRRCKYPLERECESYPFVGLFKSSAPGRAAGGTDQKNFFDNPL
jgi:hypothetical protein